MNNMSEIMEKVGVWAFYAGLIISLITAVMSKGEISPMAALALGALGIVVGLLNVIDREVKLFLVACIAFIVGASSLSALLSTVPGIGTFIPAFLQAVIIFVAPSSAIVALRAIWDITRSK